MPYFESLGDVPSHFDPNHLVPSEGIPVEGREGLENWPFVSMLNRLDGRRKFITAKGYVGLGPFAMQREDFVCIFQGVEVPFVIRKQKSCHYTLIGDAYVSGIMHGEFMAKISSYETIELC